VSLFFLEEREREREKEKKKKREIYRKREVVIER